MHGQQNVKIWKKNDHSASEAREKAAVAVTGNSAVFFGGKRGQSPYSLKVEIHDDKTSKWKSFNIETQLRNVAAHIGEGMDGYIHWY